MVYSGGKIWSDICCNISQPIYASLSEGYLQLAQKVFGYMKKYPKHGYAINTKPLTIDMDYKKVDLKMDFWNQYSYFQEEIDDRFPEPIFKN